MVVVVVVVVVAVVLEALVVVVMIIDEFPCTVSVLYRLVPIQFLRKLSRPH